ncbi:MAG TPA: hypothetical protein VFR91_09155 [Dyella sp.]|nr:hypothetical protein [Dyella sp.]
MDSTLRRHHSDLERTVRKVLGRYVDEHGCPCYWPQFEYWVSKPQGPGWQDNLQNELVGASLKLRCFSRRQPDAPRYALEAVITCTACARQWQYFSEEWRMLAFHNRLIPANPSAAAAEGAALVGADVFATAGREPKALGALDLEEWERFMLGPTTERAGRYRSILAGLAAWWKRRM